MKFNYVAANAANQTKKGVIEAPTLREATRLLFGQGWYIKKIMPAGRIERSFNQFGPGGVSMLDKVLMVKHLSTMIKSGISIHEALAIIAEQTSSARFKRILRSILERVKTGQSLSSAMTKHPKVFDPLMVNIVSVGEESGTLESNLDYLAGELEGRLELQRKIRAAAFYPSIVLFATFGLGVVLAYFVLPKITQLFKTLRFDLPVSTKILIAISGIIEAHGISIIVGLIFFAIAWRVAVSIKYVKPLWHWFLLKLPLLGGVMSHYNLSLITRTLSILLKSGLTIDQALVVAGKTTNNVIYRRRLEATLPQVQRGKRLADTVAGFASDKSLLLFPPLVIKMIDVGERSGRLDESLAYLAEYFEKEVDNTTKNLSTIVEPVLLLIVGLIVGFVAISVISPIYQVTAQFRG